MSKRFAALLLFGVGISAPVSRDGRAASPALDAEQKDHLRARLERIYYEQDLMVRNQKVDRSDVQHQEKEFEALKVFVRIPFKEDLPGLRRSLVDSSREKGLKLVGFKALPRRPVHFKSVPASMYSDENPNFKLTNDQLAEQIPFEAVVQGDRAQVDAWTRSWPEDQMRLAVSESVQADSPQRWVVRAHAFKFRETHFPRLEPREPLEVLPTWARRNPDHFAQTEPVLWSYVTRTHEIHPQAMPLYRTREQMLLNGARMSFFVALATPHADAN